MGCCYTVPQATNAVLETFGKFDSVKPPGLHFKVPCMQQIRSHVNLRTQQLTVVVESKTKDNVFVKLTIAVQFKVKLDSVYDAVYKLDDPHAQIRAYVAHTVRSVVPDLNVDSVFTARDQVSDAVEQELMKVMSACGFEIIGTLVVDIDPDPAVKAAMNNIQTAERNKVAQITRADAEKAATIKQAEAEAEAKHLSGVGLAKQRMAIVGGLSTSIAEFHDHVAGTTPQQILEVVLLNQYFDTLKEMSTHSHGSTIFLPHAPGGVAELQKQISNAFLERTTHGGNGQQPLISGGKGKMKADGKDA